MPRPRTAEYWRQRVFSYIATEPKMSARAILRELEGEWDLLLENDRETAQKAGPPPTHERTIRRIINEQPEEGKLDYRRFSWPQGIFDAGLPWESSRLILDLMRLLSPYGRPPIRNVRWYWRVCCAAPDLDIGERISIAGQFAGWEVLGDKPADEMEAIEWYLIFAPWRSKDALKEYDAAIEMGRVRAKPDLILTIGEEESIANQVEATQSKIGFASPLFAKALEDLFRHLKAVKAREGGDK